MAEKQVRRDPPVWPPRAGRPRVLVEARDDGWRRTTVTVLEQRGYEVIGCVGPRSESDEPCPAVEGGRCPGAAHADVVICDFDAADHHTRSLPTAVAHELREGASVIVLVGPADAHLHRDVLEGCRVLHRPVGQEDLLGAVATAVDELVHTPAPRSGSTRPVKWSRPPDR
jgi:AmiR/NasT family two-component response regulator